MNLQHLHLQNLVLRSTTVGSACRVHASYAGRLGIQKNDPHEDFATWARSDLWRNVGPQLSSISVQDHDSIMGPFGFGTREVGRCKGHIPLRSQPAPVARLSLPRMCMIADLASHTH